MLHRTRLAGGWLLLLALAFLLAPKFAVRPSLAADEPKSDAKAIQPDWSKLTYGNASQCADCHTQPTNNRIDQGALDIVLLAESAIWRTYDKHAQAYAVLSGDRGQKIAHLLGLKDGKDVLRAEVGCLGCHAMNNLSQANATKGGSGLDPNDGVSCGGCHGPSSAWLGPHSQKDQWRGKSALEKEALGLRDLRDPERRAAVCVSCHVGNAQEGKVVTHAMFAAGHPPLPSFEIVNFSRNEPQHWRNPIDVPYFNTNDKTIVANYHLENKQFFQTQFSLIGAVVAFRETLRLAHDRSDEMTANPSQVWPEFALLDGAIQKVKPEEARSEFAGRWPELAMAHSDCFACHHDLKYPGFRQRRGFGYFIPGHELIRVTPGRPLLRSWPLAPLTAAANFTGKKERIAELHRLLKNLATATNERPFGKPGDIKAATQALIVWSNQLIADLQVAKYTTESVRQLVEDLANDYFSSTGDTGGYAPDYETARLIASIMRAAGADLQRSLGDKWAARSDVELTPIRNELIGRLNLEPYVGRDKRLDTILDMIEVSSRRKESDPIDPRIKDGIVSFRAYLKEIGSETASKALVDNDFLDFLNRKYDSKKFVAGLNKKDVVNRLQQIGDSEETVTLKAVGEYDPSVIGPLLKRYSEIITKP